MRRIYQRDSTSVHLGAVRRFISLARKQKGTEKFIQSILPKQQKLLEKHQLCTVANEQREDAYDDILYADRDLDDTIRTTFEKCKQHDRENVSDQVLLKIFPDGTFSEIVNMPYAKEPEAAERIAATIETLGETHPLYPMAATLRVNITNVNKAIEAYKKAVTELTRTEVEEETAKAELRQQYEFNYLDARKELGLTFADRIFPALTSRTKDTETPNTDSQSGAA